MMPSDPTLFFRRGQSLQVCYLQNCNEAKRNTKENSLWDQYHIHHVSMTIPPTLLPVNTVSLQALGTAFREFGLGREQNKEVLQVVEVESILRKVFQLAEKDDLGGFNKSLVCLEWLILTTLVTMLFIHSSSYRVGLLRELWRVREASLALSLRDTLMWLLTGFLNAMTGEFKNAESCI